MIKLKLTKQSSLFGLLIFILLAACSGTDQPINNPTTTAELLTPTAVSSLPTPIAEIATATPTLPPTAVPVLTCDPFPTPTIDPPATVANYSYQIINSYPHDPNAFTQGLLFVDGVLYESTGIKRTPTSLRQVDLTSGEVLQMVAPGDAYFGEGLVLWQDKLIQLTWKNQVAFVYDRETFAQTNTFSYEN